MVVVVLGLIGCGDGGTDAARSSNTSWSADSSYRASWMEYFADDEERLPLIGAESCASEAALVGIDGDRLREAGIAPTEIADAGVIEDADPTDHDIESFAADLQLCDLEGAYAARIITIMPAFVSRADAECLGAVLVSRDDYALRLARWIYRRDAKDWIDAVAPMFNRSLVDCPEAYASITVGGLEVQYGSFSDEGSRCLTDELVSSASELLSGDAERVDPALDRVFENCIPVLGDVGEALREESE